MCIKVNPCDDGKTLGWEKGQWKSIYKHFFTYILIEPPRQYLDMGDRLGTQGAVGILLFLTFTSLYIIGVSNYLYFKLTYIIDFENIIF